MLEIEGQGMEGQGMERETTEIYLLPTYLSVGKMLLRNGFIYHLHQGGAGDGLAKKADVLDDKTWVSQDSFKAAEPRQGLSYWRPLPRSPKPDSTEAA